MTTVTVGTIIEDKTVSKVLHTAKILHEWWEFDTKAWLVEFGDGSRAILTTSHNTSLYIADKSEFEEKLRETESSATSIRILLQD